MMMSRMVVSSYLWSERSWSLLFLISNTKRLYLIGNGSLYEPRAGEGEACG